MNLGDFEQREQQLLSTHEPQWVERWREPTGALTAVRFDPTVTLALFGGVLTDDAADWLEPKLERMLAGQQQLHFIDQGELETPNG